MLKIAIAQINPIVGDFECNKKLILEYIEKAESKCVDLLVFPELSICGYDPKDLVLRDDFCEKSVETLKELVSSSVDYDIGFIVGGINMVDEKRYNSVFFIYKGEIILEHKKVELPNYGVFDEKRLYSSGEEFDQNSYVKFKNINIGLLVCEDIWINDNYAKLCGKNRLDVVVTINASPFYLGKYKERVDIISNQVKSHKVPLIYANMVGASDNLVYDGGSIYFNSDGIVIFQADFFKSDLYLVDKGDTTNCEYIEDKNRVLYDAIVLSLRDYLAKNSFNSVVLGYSSGIDSTLVSLIAIDALGIDKVKLLCMPSRYTSEETWNDARKFLGNIGYNNHDIIEIDDIYQLFVSKINNLSDLASQNLQSRIRGCALMSIANSVNALLLSTGNKSEIAVGYCTLYGDTNGGFNPIKDLYKTQVYEIAKWRNENFIESSKLQRVNLIPQNIIYKAPTAELKFNQKDSDSIPEYEILDEILFEYIENRKSLNDIASLGFDQKIVEKVINLIRISQFKRSQSAIGPKLSKCSFDLDFRHPITSKFIK